MSNPYPARFTTLLADTDGPVLDCGSGGRTHRRVISLEYVHHPAIDVRADGMALPFPTDTFALILSQAVVEHVTDPQRLVDELVRVLAPGGLLYIEGAFLQPVHMAPAHYFNVTPFGLAHLCRDLDVLEVGAFGSMAENWDWIGAEAGAREALGATRFAQVRREMAVVDAAMTPAQQWNVAPAVSLLGRKRDDLPPGALDPGLPTP